MNDNDNTPANEASQDARRLYFTLVTGQVVFLADGEPQMITQSTFGSSPDPEYPAAYILRLQNTLASQIKNDVEYGGRKFERALDVIILGMIPLGCMTYEEFWANMDIPMPTPDTKEALVNQTDNVVPLQPKKTTPPEGTLEA